MANNKSVAKYYIIDSFGSKRNRLSHRTYSGLSYFSYLPISHFLCLCVCLSLSPSHLNLDLVFQNMLEGKRGDQTQERSKFIHLSGDTGSEKEERLETRG